MTLKQAPTSGAAKYRHQITFWKRSFTTVSGESVPSWNEYCMAWAMFAARRMRNVAANVGTGGVVQDQTSYDVDTRYTPLLATIAQGDMITTKDGRILEIVTRPHNRDELNVELQFTCVEAEPTGFIPK